MSSDKQFYDKLKILGQEITMAEYIRPYIDQWMPLLLTPDKSGLRMLDLGAGTCTTALTVSRSPCVSAVHCCDISSIRMREMSAVVNGHVKGNADKLSFHEIDFNEPLPFDDGFFDLIVMDAALHHSRNIWLTLSELRRVVAPDGVFVAQREAYTSPLTNKRTFRRLLESEEVKAGVSENAYLKSQYDYYIRVAGFIPEFFPVYENRLFKSLFFLNGIVFSKYNIISRPDPGHKLSQ